MENLNPRPLLKALLLPTSFLWPLPTLPLLRPMWLLRPSIRISRLARHCDFSAPALMPPAYPIHMGSTGNIQNTKCTVPPSKPLLGLSRLQEQSVAFQDLGELQLPASSWGGAFQALGWQLTFFPFLHHSSPSPVFSSPLSSSLHCRHTGLTHTAFVFDLPASSLHRDPFPPFPLSQIPSHLFSLYLKI